MKRVAASEFDLLTVTRALVGQLGERAVEPLLRQSSKKELPSELGPTAVGLFEQMLARGAIHELCRRGGWRRAEHLAGDEIVTGRAWERHPQLALRFSPLSIQLLRWLVASPLAMPDQCRPFGGKRSRRRKRSAPGPAELGDQLLFYLACDLAERCGCSASLASSPQLRGSALCWVGFADLLARDGPPTAEELSPARLAPLMEGDGAIVLEALQADLARRWVEAERGKRQIRDLQRMSDLGLAQRAVIEALCDAAEGAGRQDLAGFLLEGGGVVLRHRPAAETWVAGLAGRGALQERSDACAAAGALLTGLERLHRWIEEARAVRFFDDEYDASQLLLRRWELLGEESYEHARQQLQRLRSLEIAAPPRREDEETAATPPSGGAAGTEEER